MRELLKATTQFALEATIYFCKIGLERLAVTRPMMDEPLPDGPMPGPIDDFSGYHLGPDPEAAVAAMKRADMQRHMQRHGAADGHPRNN